MLKRAFLRFAARIDSGEQALLSEAAPPPASGGVRGDFRAREPAFDKGTNREHPAPPGPPSKVKGECPERPDWNWEAANDGDVASS